MNQFSSNSCTHRSLLNTSESLAIQVNVSEDEIREVFKKLCLRVFLLQLETFEHTDGGIGKISLTVFP